jgi:hypothetical protein
LAQVYAYYQFPENQTRQGFFCHIYRNPKLDKQTLANNGAHICLWNK